MKPPVELPDAGARRNEPARDNVPPFDETPRESPIRTFSARATEVQFRYRKGARDSDSRRGVEAVDLDVSAGEIVGLLGPNGSGKSTLLRLLGTALRPDRGRIEHRLGGGASGQNGVRRRMGQAADVPVHIDVLTGAENARFFARASGLSRAEADGRTRPLMEALGLAAHADVPVSAYSFGMSRKLLLVQALAHDPPLLLLDEPTIGLDPDSMAELERLLDQRARAGAAIVVATNDVGWIEGVATRVAFLHEGQKVADASPAELLAQVEGRTEIEFTIETDAGRLDRPAPLNRPERLGSPSPLDPPAILDPSLLDLELLELPPGCSVRLVPGRLLVDAPGPEALPPLCRTLLDAGVDIRGVRLTPPTLAGIFRRLTGVGLEADVAEWPGRRREES